MKLRKYSSLNTYGMNHPVIEYQLFNKPGNISSFMA